MNADPRATPALEAAPLVVPGALRIEPTTRTAVTLLRAPAETAMRIAALTGLTLPESRNAVQGMGGAMTLRTEEESWLFLTSADAEPALLARLGKAFADRRHQIVDLTDATPGLLLYGPAARALLAHVMAEDVGAQPAGTHALAVIAGAEIRVIAEAEHRLRLLMRRPHAAHIRAALAHAGRAFGLTAD